MTQDERLIPAGRPLDKSLAELTQARPYGKYDRYSNPPAETNVREYLFVVLKRKWLILSLVLVVTSLVTIQAYRQPSIYEASTTIRIESKPVPVLSTGQVVINSQTDPAFWGTQLKLLQSPSLARQVALSLKLQDNPAFFGGAAQSSVFASLKRIFSRERSATPTKSDPSSDQPVGAEQMQERQLSPEESAKLEPYEDAIIGGETVEPIQGTSLVTIKYQHTDPVLAQKIANSLAEVFVQNNRERQDIGTSNAEEKLMKEVATYQEKINKEQTARFEFAKNNDLPIVATAGPSQVAVRSATYSAQLLAAENERRNLEAAYEAAKSAQDPFANPEVQKDQLIIKLREKISDLKDKEAALKEKYTDKWPEVQQVQAQIRQTEEELKKAPTQVMASMKAKADAAKAQEKSLLAAYTKEHGVATQQTKSEIELAARTQELANDVQYLNVLNQKVRELNATGSDRGTDVRIETASRLPREPVGPQRMRNIMIAFVLALVAGIGLAFLLDYLDDTIKSLDDVDRYIHLPALALIPSVRSEKRLRGGEAPKPSDTTALAMVNDVRSPIAESYRHLRTSLLLSSAGMPPKTILVTSSQPSEGKTTTAINTAFMLAQTGADVLIIDCDLRRPRLHAHFNLPNSRGLTNCLSGESEVDELLQTYPALPKLKLLTSGPIPPNPAELLGSEEMRKLLVSLGEKFTHIIVDSPPAISFTDSSILSTFVDGVILVVHGGRSSRAVVRRAKQQLVDVGAHIFGVVLNNVKVEAHDSYYYASYYSGYYKSDEYEDDGTAKSDARAASS